MARPGRKWTTLSLTVRSYQQADRILVEAAPILPLLYERFHLLVKPGVKKYPTSPMTAWFWKDVIIEPH